MRDNLPATRDTRIKNIIKKINKQTKKHKILDQLKKKILTGKKNSRPAKKKLLTHENKSRKINICILLDGMTSGLVILKLNLKK